MNTIMKYLLSTILVLFCILWGLSSCELEHSDNGKLDGFWHLTEVETLATKSHTEKREELVFWAVQGRLMQLMRNGFICVSSTKTILFRYTNHDKTIV